MYYGSFFLNIRMYCILMQHIVDSMLYIYIYTSHMFMDTILVGGHPLFDFHTRGPSGETR